MRDTEYLWMAIAAALAAAWLLRRPATPARTQPSRYDQVSEYDMQDPGAYGP
jgi:hypothetical protein